MAPVSRCLSCPQPACGQFIQVGGGIYIESGAGQLDDVWLNARRTGQRDMPRQAVLSKCKGERRGWAQQQYVGALASAVVRYRHRRRIGRTLCRGGEGKHIFRREQWQVAKYNHQRIRVPPQRPRSAHIERFVQPCAYLT